MGLVASLARPGGNITGIDLAYVDLRAKSLQLLREVVPNASHIGFLARPDNPANMRSWRQVDAAGPSLGVKMRRFDVKEPADIDRAFALIARDRVGGLIVPGDPSILGPHGQKIVDLAAQIRIPALYSGRSFVDAGGLMSYGHDSRHNARLLATYVHRILNGAKPAELPVERPAKLELVINMSTARAIGVQIPPSLLARADDIVE
jgi:putative ABC transport system substrate-binding protein